ncbi:hypothetical protein D9M71_683320 [compost metagenome]
MQFDVTPGDGTGGEVEDIRMLARPRPAEGDGVGAEHRPMPAGRRDPGMAGGERQGHQAGLGQLLDLDP